MAQGDIDWTKILAQAGTAALAGAPAGPGGMLAAAGATAVAGLISWLIENNYESEANDILQKARDKYGTIDDSSVRAAASEVLGPTNLAKIQAEPRYRALQDDALSRLSQLSRAGLSLSDRAALSESMGAAGQEAKIAQDRATQAARQMGMGGSGLELAASLQGAQSSANRAAQASRQIAASAQDRALQALSARTALAGNLETTDYERAAAAAKAQDAIDRFNNETRYNRAMDEYNRRLGQANRMYGFEQDRAGQTRQTGARYADAAGGTLRALGGLATRWPSGADEPTVYGNEPENPNFKPAYVPPGTPSPGSSSSSGGGNSNDNWAEEDNNP